MKLVKPLILTILGWLPFYSPLGTAQQVCNTANMTADAPDSRYVMNAEGVTVDKKTGLMWMRCVLGQQWSNGICTGNAQTYDWQDALQIAETTVLANFSDWRLPNKKELQSVLERRCYSPAVNLRTFPDTPSAWFWTSSAYVSYGYDVWMIDFTNGASYNFSKNLTGYVRLVRGKQ